MSAPTDADTTTGASSTGSTLRDVFTVARNDFRNKRRSKLVWGVLAIYGIFVALLFFAGGQGSNPDVSQTLFGQVFMTALVLPLVAVAASYLAVAGERESDTVRFLLSQPLARRSVILGKFLSRGLLVASALVLAVVVSLGIIAVMYPAFEAVALAKFLGVSLLLVSAYVSVSVAISSVSASRSRAIAGAVGFYFLSDILILFGNFSLVGALKFLLEDTLGLSLHEYFYEAIHSLFPAQAYINSTLSIFSPENFQRIQVPGDLPFYLEPWFMIVILACWIVLPIVGAILAFDRAEIG